jgi:hypothetical protein
LMCLVGADLPRERNRLLGPLECRTRLALKRLSAALA